MKTKTWIIIIVGFCLLCLAAAALLPCLTEAATTAQVYSDGVLVLTLDLTKNGDYRVANEYGINLLHVEGGKISVAEASCPTQDCVRHAPSDRGAPIVCLPNRMVIRFSRNSDMDALVG